MQLKIIKKDSLTNEFGLIEFWDQNTCLFTVGGKLMEFFNWILGNKDYISDEIFFYGNEINSLSQRINEARNIDFNEELDDNKVFDYWHKQIYDYYKTHGLTFALRGFNNLDVIIGKNQGHGEFSCYEDGKELFRYDFDFNDFYREVESKYQELINES